MTIKDIEKLLLAVAGAEESYRFSPPFDNETSIYGRIKTATFEAVFGVRHKITRPGFEVELFNLAYGAEVDFPSNATCAEVERCIQAMVGAFEATYAVGRGEALDD